MASSSSTSALGSSVILTAQNNQQLYQLIEMNLEKMYNRLAKSQYAPNKRAENEQMKNEITTALRLITDRLHTEITSTINEFNDHKNDFDVLTEKFGELSERFTCKQMKKRDWKQQCNRLVEEINELENHINDLENEIGYYHTHTDIIENRLGYYMNQYDDLEKDNSVAEFSIRRLIKQKAILTIQNQWRKFKLSRINTNTLPRVQSQVSWLLLH